MSSPVAQKLYGTAIYT